MITLISLLNISDFSLAETLAVDLVNHVENMYRQTGSRSRIKMIVSNPRWEQPRKINIEAWSLGSEYTLIRIISPKKDKGISTLKRKKMMWNYFPRIRRTIRISAAMMMNSWMGSDFTNDDLVKQTQLTRDYDLQLKTYQTNYEITLTPKEHTATVWGKILIVLTKKTRLPVEQKYFDESGQLKRTLLFSKPVDFSGITLPSVLKMRSVNDPQKHTQINYESIEWKQGLSEDFFSLQNLERSGHN